MDGGTLYSIGDLARRTGLTVKAIRFYSDRGIVPPTDRSPAGHRRYDLDAAARLDLVRTLRELGLDLPSIRRVADREVSLSEVAATHAEALAVRVRVLGLRRAVLMAVARRGATPRELELMHALAKLSEAERHRLVADFLGAALGDVPDGVARSLTPELPDDPDPDQVEAWVELAELAQDPDFRASMRRMADRHVPGLARDPVATVRDEAGPAVAAGVSPTSPRAAEIVARVAAAHPSDLLARLEAANDPRRDRYLQLLAVINGWPSPAGTAPAIDWFVRAVRARSG